MYIYYLVLSSLDSQPLDIVHYYIDSSNISSHTVALRHTANRKAANFPSILLQHRTYNCNCENPDAMAAYNAHDTMAVI